MIALLCFFLTVLVSPFKSKSRLEAENVALRRQLIILRRKVRGRVHLSNRDRLFLVQLYRWFPSVLNTITIIRPETVVRWHRAGFRRYCLGRNRWMHHHHVGHNNRVGDRRDVADEIETNNENDYRPARLACLRDEYIPNVRHVFAA
jgi:hypothetical protein